MKRYRFDEFAKALAAGVSRRRMLKTLGAGVGAAVAGWVGWSGSGQSQGLQGGTPVPVPPGGFSGCCCRCLGAAQCAGNSPDEAGCAALCGGAGSIAAFSCNHLCRAEESGTLQCRRQPTVDAICQPQDAPTAALERQLVNLANVVTRPSDTGRSGYVRLDGRVILDPARLPGLSDDQRAALVSVGLAGAYVSAIGIPPQAASGGTLAHVSGARMVPLRGLFGRLQVDPGNVEHRINTTIYVLPEGDCVDTAFEVVAGTYADARVEERAQQFGDYAMTWILTTTDQATGVEVRSVATVAAWQHFLVVQQDDWTGAGKRGLNPHVRELEPVQRRLVEQFADAAAGVSSLASDRLVLPGRPRELGLTGDVYDGMFIPDADLTPDTSRVQEARYAQADNGASATYRWTREWEFFVGITRFETEDAARAHVEGGRQQFDLLQEIGASERRPGAPDTDADWTVHAFVLPSGEAMIGGLGSISRAGEVDREAGVTGPITDVREGEGAFDTLQRALGDRFDRFLAYSERQFSCLSALPDQKDELCQPFPGEPSFDEVGADEVATEYASCDATCNRPKRQDQIRPYTVSCTANKTCTDKGCTCHLYRREKEDGEWEHYAVQNVKKSLDDDTYEYECRCAKAKESGTGATTDEETETTAPIGPTGVVDIVALSQYRLPSGIDLVNGVYYTSPAAFVGTMGVTEDQAAKFGELGLVDGYALKSAAPEWTPFQKRGFSWCVRPEEAEAVWQYHVDLTSGLEKVPTSVTGALMQTPHQVLLLPDYQLTPEAQPTAATWLTFRTGTLIGGVWTPGRDPMAAVEAGNLMLDTVWSGTIPGDGLGRKQIHVDDPMASMMMNRYYSHLDGQTQRFAGDADEAFNRRVETNAGQKHVLHSEQRITTGRADVDFAMLWDLRVFLQAALATAWMADVPARLLRDFGVEPFAITEATGLAGSDLSQGYFYERQRPDGGVDAGLLIYALIAQTVVVLSIRAAAASVADAFLGSLFREGGLPLALAGVELMLAELALLNDGDALNGGWGRPLPAALFVQQQ